jgi:hypothetical protein
VQILPPAVFSAGFHSGAGLFRARDFPKFSFCRPVDQVASWLWIPEILFVSHAVCECLKVEVGRVLESLDQMVEFSSFFSCFAHGFFVTHMKCLMKCV